MQIDGQKVNVAKSYDRWQCDGDRQSNGAGRCSIVQQQQGLGPVTVQVHRVQLSRVLVLRSVC